jgi:hypothetical protein
VCFAKHYVLRKNYLGPKPSLFFYVGRGLTQPYGLDPPGPIQLLIQTRSVFDSVVAGAFQIAFRAEMHANDFFYFLKIIFDINTSK